MEQTVEAQNAARTRSQVRRFLVVAGVLVAVLAIYVFVQFRAQAADDRRVDGYYCTLEGVGPFDRAPRTGELCIDL